MKTKPGLIVLALISVLFFSRCMLVGIIAMSIQEKKTVETWKSGNYKTCIQRRAGWVRPYRYYCRVKEKRLGGLYYRKIMNRQVSTGYYAGYDIKFPVNMGDTIVVNSFNDTTFLIKSSLNH